MYIIAGTKSDGIDPSIYSRYTAHTVAKGQKAQGVAISRWMEVYLRNGASSPGRATERNGMPRLNMEVTSAKPGKTHGSRRSSGKEQAFVLKSVMSGNLDLNGARGAFLNMATNIEALLEDLLQEKKAFSALGQEDILSREMGR